MTAEQTAIQARLLELEGVDIIQSTLRKTHIRGDDDMAVDNEPEPYVSPTLLAKQKALARFVSLGYFAHYTTSFYYSRRV